MSTIAHDSPEMLPVAGIVLFSMLVSMLLAERFGLGIFLAH